MPTLAPTVMTRRSQLSNLDGARLLLTADVVWDMLIDKTEDVGRIEEDGRVIEVLELKPIEVVDRLLFLSSAKKPSLILKTFVLSSQSFPIRSKRATR